MSGPVPTVASVLRHRVNPYLETQDMHAEPSRRREMVVAYALACGLFGLALWLELLLGRAGPEFRFLAFSLSVAVSAWYGGLGPGVLAILLAILASDYFLLGPGVFLRFDSTHQFYALTAFALGWLAVGLAFHATYRRMERERNARHEAARAAAQSDRIAQLTAALGQARTSAGVIEASIQEPLKALRADAGMLLLIGEDRTSASIARAVAYKPNAREQHEPVSLLIQSPVRDAVQRGVPVIPESLDTQRADHPGLTGNVLNDYQATITVPLVVRRRVVAVVRLDFSTTRLFIPHDREYVAVLATSAAQALDRAWQYESAQRGRADAEALRERADQELVERHKTENALRASETRYRALATRTTRMHELTAALSEAVTVNAVAKAVVQYGSVLVGAVTGAVSILVDNGTRFDTLNLAPSEAASSEATTFAAEKGLCVTDVVETSEPVFVASWAESQEQYWRSASQAADAAYLSSAVLPLLVEGTPIGTLEFHFSVPVNFDAEYRALLISVALHCAQALDRARLYESAQRARAEAETANRLKDDFLSIVSHELRTPLNAVVGWASLLRQRAVTPDMTARAVQSIYDNAVRQAKLIDDLLDLSRIEAGQATLDLEEVDIATLITGVVESVIPAATSDQVDVSVRSMPPAVVRGDRRRLEQVFFNLLSNALKFTPSGGRIVIEATSADGLVEVHVSDNGAGIAPEFLPYVFDRFRQGDPSRTRSHGGLGLGLSIAKQFVEAHGGSITVESAGPQLGTTFSVTLPLVVRRIDRALATGGARSLPGASGAPRLDGITVLVVDDESDAREIIAHALQACGARVTVASGARDAFDVLASTDIDVLLSDIAMPDEDGYSLIRRVRASTNTRVATIPAVAVTAHARKAEREQAFAAGFQRHLAKPVEPADLARTVDQLVHHGGVERVN
jgi:signal transduction histidine kinase/ActR/RegA family two-component response regulator